MLDTAIKDRVAIQMLDTAIKDRKDGICTKIWQLEGCLIKKFLIMTTLLRIGIGVAQVMPLWPLMTCGKALAILFSVGIVATMCAKFVLSAMPLILVGITLLMDAETNEKELRISNKDSWVYAFVGLGVGALLGEIGATIVTVKFIPIILAVHILSVGGHALLVNLMAFAAMGTGMLIGGIILASAFWAINKLINQPFHKATAFCAFVALGAFLGEIGALIVTVKFIPIIFTGHILSVGGHALLVNLMAFAAMGTGMLIGGLISGSAFLAINKWINQPFDKATALMKGNNADSTKFPGAMNKTDTCSLGP